MPDVLVPLLLMTLALLIDASPVVRIPIGLVLAMGALLTGMPVLVTALCGAVGIVVSRLLVVAAARLRTRRRGRRGQLAHSSEPLRAHQQRLREHLSRSPNYANVTFLLATLPGVSSTLLFPVLAAMRTPVLPALAGTLAGRIPILLVTTSVFCWLGRLGGASARDGAITLTVVAVLLLVVGAIRAIDWDHRRRTGEWRLVDEQPIIDLVWMSRTDTRPRPWRAPASDAATDHTAADGDDIIDGVVLGEELDDGPDARTQGDDG